jgi:hypothetical protein
MISRKKKPMKFQRLSPKENHSKPSNLTASKLCHIEKRETNR